MAALTRTGPGDLRSLGEVVANMSDRVAWEISRKKQFDVVLVEAAHDHIRKSKQWVKPAGSDQELARQLHYEEEFPSLPLSEVKVVEGLGKGTACQFPQFPVTAMISTR